MAVRDPRTGRFVRIQPEAPYAGDSKFGTVAEDGLDVGFEGADPRDLAYDSTPRYAPGVEGPGSRSPLRARRPTMVDARDADHTIYGRQGAVLRTAARSSIGRWDDPTAYLVGLESPGSPVTGVKEVSDDMPDIGAVRGDLRPASRGEGRLRDRR